MQLDRFEPASTILDRVVLGSGDWEKGSRPSVKEVVDSRLPFTDVRKAIVSAQIQPTYSLDGKNWTFFFPYEEALNQWKEAKEAGAFEGLIRIRISVMPTETMIIREIGIFSGERLIFYDVLDKEFVIGKLADSDMRPYFFNYNLKCIFVSSENINLIAKMT